MGDIYSPNIFDRIRRLDHADYQQFLVAKNLGSRLTASVDYTNQWGSKTLRGVVHLAVPDARFIDAVQVDFYQRTNGDRANGFNLGLAKAISKRISVTGGFTAIDQN